jgi:hypothetical protein
MQLTAVDCDEDQTALNLSFPVGRDSRCSTIGFDERRMGAAMRRLIMIAAMVVLGWAWPGVAFAQLGVPSLGPGPEPGLRRANQRPKLRRSARYYAATPVPPPPLGGTARGRSSHPGTGSFSFTGIVDDSGRADLSGHPVSQYPVVRGDIDSAHGPRVPRGGANGNAHPHSPKKPPTDPFEAALPPH